METVGMMWSFLIASRGQIVIFIGLKTLREAAHGQDGQLIL